MVSRARIVSLVVGLALALTASFASPRDANAAPIASAASASFWYAGTRLAFERPQLRAGALAVGSDDMGLGRFLTKLGATLAYQPGGNTIIVTSGDRRVVTFSVGDARFAVDGVTQTAAFAPYTAGGVAFLPFVDLARALYVIPVADGATTVMQPQISGLDISSENRVTIVRFRGASPLHFKRLSDVSDEKVSLAFLGIASTLDHDRSVAGAGLKNVSIVAGGTPKNPTTVITFEAPPGGTHVLIPSDSPNELAIVFGPHGVSLGGTAVPADGGPTIATAPLVVRDARDARAAVPTVAPAPISGLLRGGTTTPTAMTLPVATITNFATSDNDGGVGVHLSIAGNVTYEWHRLPDYRWYVDLKPATLAIASQDLALQNPAVQSLRIKAFVGPIDKLPTVRVALSLPSPRIVTLVPDGDGLTLAVDRLDDVTATRTATGQLSGGKLVASVPLPPPPPPPVAIAPAPTPTDDGAGTDASWKFAPPVPAGTNGKLIVIDPGHGGSDAGAAHNGLQEAALNLDVSKRLRRVLVARGWQVKLTREDDVDVYQPNDSAHDELQARDDIANAAGARLFVSIHTNAFTSSSLNGTTTYFINSDSASFAQAIHARLAAALPTKDDGVRKENFYVIHHTKMPAVLIEMAFCSNPGDAALLKTDAFLQNVAVSIADGVRDFANTQSTSVSSHPAVYVDGQ